MNITLKYPWTVDTCTVDSSSMRIGESAARDLKKRRTKENRTPKFEEGDLNPIDFSEASRGRGANQWRRI